MTDRSVALWGMPFAVLVLAVGFGCSVHRPPPAEPVPTSDPRAAEVQRLLLSSTRGPDAERAARAALIAMGPDIIPTLVGNLHATNYFVRWEIVNVLGYLGDTAAVGALIERSLGDPDPQVRWRALWALGEIQASTIPESFRVALADPDPTRRWNAAVGASMFGVGAALARLQAGLGDPDEFRCWEAINGLARITDASSVAPLVKVMASRAPKLRREATLTLGKLASPAARDALVAILNDSDPEVRWRAAMVLAEFPDDATRAALRRRLEVEEHPEVRKKLSGSMARVGRGH